MNSITSRHIFWQWQIIGCSQSFDRSKFQLVQINKNASPAAIGSPENPKLAGHARRIASQRCTFITGISQQNACQRISAEKSEVSGLGARGICRSD